MIIQYLCHECKKSWQSKDYHATCGCGSSKISGKYENKVNEREYIRGN